MIYELYQAQADLVDPLRLAARTGSTALKQVRNSAGSFSRVLSGWLAGPMPWPSFMALDLGLRHASAALDVFAHGGTTHDRPSFGLDPVMVGDVRAEVREEPALRAPFGTLLHFRKEVDGETVGAGQPKVLLVAPLSGHFPTLLRHTVEVLLTEHDVFVTDWHNARDVPLAEGPFGFDDHVAHLIAFIEALGPRSHLVAVCQPTVQALVAVAVMAEAANPCTPRSLTLMAGPIDTRANPTKVNQLAKSRPITWFEEKMIGVVPQRYPGGGRRVYPGFLQLSAFMSMNLDRHLLAQIKYLGALVTEDHPSAESHRRFYDEYLAVMDLPAEFYLETVQRIFQDHTLPLGELSWRGQPVRLDAIDDTFLLTIEGERDDICGLGQTAAALDLCTGLRPAFKRHHMQTAVGHYGVFSGRRWEQEIYPLLREVIQFRT